MDSHKVIAEISMQDKKSVFTNYRKEVIPKVIIERQWLVMKLALSPL